MTVERFMKVYANLPLNLRKEIVAVIDDQPISWEVAYLEIHGNTELGKKILNKIVELQFV